MTESQQLTSEGSRTRRTGRVAAILFALAAILGVAAFSAVQALPAQSYFQLDGNTADDGAGIDWYNLYPAAVDSTTASFRADGTPTEDSIFWGGGSKDVRDIGEWRWKSGPPTSDKSDIQNVATAMETVGGDKILYFAADRYSTEGNAKIGFWFLQSAVGPAPDGSFYGSHTEGDLLIEADWTTGSAKTRGLRVYKWESGRLTAVAGAGYGQCAADLSSFDLCAISNGSSFSPPWPYSGKRGTSYEPGAFLEGAINLTEIYETVPPCFPSVIANTRASGSSVNASLEDFALAGVPNCSITIRKSATDDTSVEFDFTTGGGVLAGGSFDLKDGEHVTYAPLSATSYTVTEAVRAGWTLTAIACTPAGKATVDLPNRRVTISLAEGGNVDCTFTNRRTPTIEVVKSVVPNTDGGRFNLQIDGVSRVTNVGDTGTTGALEVTAGISHTVGETAYAGTNLADYRSSISCRNNGGAAVTYDGTTSTAFAVAYGDRWVCTITNNRESSINVVKQLIPANDAGRFNLKIDATTYTTNVGNGGSTGDVVVQPGAHVVSEVAYSGTDLANYIASTVCRKAGSLTEYTAGINVSSGDRWTCTITNIRKPTLILEKISTGAAGAFQFDVSSGSPLVRYDLTTLTTVTSAPDYTGGTYGATKSYRIDTTGGTFRFAELTMPANFTLTDLTCGIVAAGTGTTQVGAADLVGGSITVTNLAAGAVVRCTFTNSGAFSTRTQGFWSTHLELASAVWSATSGDDPAWSFVGMKGGGPRRTVGNYRPPATFRAMTSGDGYMMFGRSFCGTEVTAGALWTSNPTGGPKLNGDSALMGGFWAGISNKSTGAARSSLDQARMQLLQQLLAAMLNNRFFGSSPTGSISILAAQNAFCGGTIGDVQAAAGAMAAFNEFGDNSGLTPGGSANPRAAKTVASAPFWDNYPMYPIVSLELTAATGVDHTGGSISWCITSCSPNPITFTTTTYTNNSVRVGPAGVKIVLNDVTGGTTSYDTETVSVLSGGGGGDCDGPVYDDVAGTSTFVCTVTPVTPSSNRGSVRFSIRPL